MYVSEERLGLFSIASECIFGNHSEPVEGVIVKSERRFESMLTDYPDDLYDIRYSYKVAGSSLSGRVVGCELRHENVTERLTDFPVGKYVMVYIDPEKPSFAILDPSRVVGWSVYLRLGFILIFLPLFTYVILRM